ncbi:copper amine oxidase N-terminal domain-containing protein [Acidaminobacter sp. JC074]|uniref:stalk domain-containing protein n=1 Tax=Acidaminobacter sp. JC074 TaxID=2530199 RepID=UPI001F0D2D81|nr:stalk domain-containing protein [Acidaminobacter sp. JC074]MCH4890279.1 copper amine oxidase N-terminal domain-containing protein [Acidaminobacter sp. JC074]
MRKTIFVVLLMILMLPVTYGEDIISYDVNVIVDNQGLDTYDEEQDIEVKPLILNNRTLIPLRAISNAFGISNEQIKWEAESKTVYLKTNSNDTIMAQVGNNKLNLNEKKLTIDVAPQIIDNRLYLPLSAISTLFDVDVTWNSESRNVTLKPSEYVLGNSGIKIVWNVNKKFIYNEFQNEGSNDSFYAFRKMEGSRTHKSIVINVHNIDFYDFIDKKLVELNLSGDDFIVLTSKNVNMYKEFEDYSITYLRVGTKCIELTCKNLDEIELMEFINNVEEVK